MRKIFLFASLTCLSPVFGTPLYIEYCKQLGANQQSIDNTIIAADNKWPLQYDINKFDCQKALDRIHQIKSLLLTGPLEFSVAPFEGNRDIESIKSLSATFVDLEALGKLPALKEFIGEQVEFENGILKGFTANQPLEVIELSYTNLTSIQLPKMRYLKMVAITGAPYFENLEALSGQPMLNYVYLWNTSKISSVKPLLNCPSLTKVYLGDMSKNTPGVYELVKKGVQVIFNNSGAERSPNSVKTKK